jgi:[acyl-carrier-protein] S-malonyltransferase
MEPAEPGLRVQLDDVELKPLRFPVVSNVTAKPVRDVVEARRLLIQQLTSAVRWTACVRTMIEAGVTELVELGPNAVLTGLLKRIDRNVKARAVGTAAEVNEWQS